MSVILVLASRRDAGARHLVRVWGPARARLVTPDDLSTPGWRIRNADPASMQAVVEGMVVDGDALDGVVTRLSIVTQQDIRTIQDEDRGYAAVEMTAFLNHWLAALQCPVLNPPGTTSLCGPGWRSERWVAAASKLGMRVRTRRREVAPFRPDGEEFLPTPGVAVPGKVEPNLSVTVVGGHCIGTDDPGLAEFANALAAQANARMLTVMFAREQSGVTFLGANPWVNTFNPEITEAMLACFAQGSDGRAPDMSLQK